MKTTEMETALMSHYGVRQNIIVPNVSWAFLHYEADLVILTGSNYATEIEIKVTKADLKKDKEKRHNHDSELFKYLYFAVPNKLTEFALTEIPEKAGLLEVIDRGEGYQRFVRQVKPAVLNNQHRQWKNHERSKLAEIGCMRILGLKEKINRYKISEIKNKKLFVEYDLQLKVADKVIRKLEIS